MIRTIGGGNWVDSILGFSLTVGSVYRASTSIVVDLRFQSLSEVISDFLVGYCKGESKDFVWAFKVSFIFV